MLPHEGHVYRRAVIASTASIHARPCRVVSSWGTPSLTATATLPARAPPPSPPNPTSLFLPPNPPEPLPLYLTHRTHVLRPTLACSHPCTATRPAMMTRRVKRRCDEQERKGRPAVQMQEAEEQKGKKISRRGLRQRLSFGPDTHSTRDAASDSRRTEGLSLRWSQPLALSPFISNPCTHRSRVAPHIQSRRAAPGPSAARP